MKDAHNKQKNSKSQSFVSGGNKRENTQKMYTFEEFADVKAPSKHTTIKVDQKDENAQKKKKKKKKKKQKKKKKNKTRRKKKKKKKNQKKQKQKKTTRKKKQEERFTRRITN